MKRAPLRFLVDEDFDHDILRGLKLREPTLDLATLRERQMLGREDPQVLELAAKEGRVLLSHDKTTMRHFAMDRLREGKRMPGLLLVHRDAPMGRVIEDILLIALASLEGEAEGRVFFIPLR